MLFYDRSTVLCSLASSSSYLGHYRCEKNCPHFNGIRICSHTVVTAQQNGELLDFLNYYKQSCAKRGINLSLTVRTDMPKNPGRKGGVPSTARRASPNLPINERVKRSYFQNSIPNVNPDPGINIPERPFVKFSHRRSLASSRRAFFLFFRSLFSVLRPD